MFVERNVDREGDYGSRVKRFVLGSETSFERVNHDRHAERTTQNATECRRWQEACDPRVPPKIITASRAETDSPSNNEQDIN